MKRVEAVARLLAREHARSDPGIEKAFWIPAIDEVRLIEVTTSVPDCGEFLPFRFAPDPPDVLYPCVVVALSPGDWARKDALDVPPDFRSGYKQVYPQEPER